MNEIKIIDFLSRHMTVHFMLLARIKKKLLFSYVNKTVLMETRP